MIKPLRKYHFILWRLLALVLPLSFAYAIVERPKHPIIKKIKKNSPFLFEVKELPAGVLRITVSVTEPLRSPSAVVYAETKNLKYLLGKIHQQGAYVFVFPQPQTTASNEITIRVYNAIHHKEIASSTFIRNTR